MGIKSLCALLDSAHTCSTIPLRKSTLTFGLPFPESFSNCDSCIYHIFRFFTTIEADVRTNISRNGINNHFKDFSSIIFSYFYFVGEINCIDNFVFHIQNSFWKIRTNPLLKSKVLKRFISVNNFLLFVERPIHSADFFKIFITYASRF
uniref:Uncharacterized protein n=1 Tax=Strongyloides venezuelensis TaxID=75913 RepID=A0A0K0FRB0_STRVS